MIIMSLNDIIWSSPNKHPSRLSGKYGDGLALSYGKVENQWLVM